MSSSSPLQSPANFRGFSGSLAGRTPVSTSLKSFHPSGGSSHTHTRSFMVDPSLLYPHESRQMDSTQSEDFEINSTRHTYASTSVDNNHNNSKNAYIHLQYLEFDNARLKKEVMTLQAQLQTSKETYEKLLERLDRVPRSESTRLPAFKDIPPPLHQKNYQKVTFWSEKSYEEYMKRDDGDTDGFATKKPRRGRPSNTLEDDDEKSAYPYLEDDSGVPVDRQRLTKFGDRARKVFNSLKHADLAPASWGQLGLDAYEYFKIEMVSEFREFRLCEGFWKLDRWAARAYASWIQNIRRQEGVPAKHTRMKRKRSTSPKNLPLFDDTGLIKMDNLKFEDSTLDAQTVTQAVSLPVAPISEGAIAVHGSPVTSITPLRSSIVGVTSLLSFGFR